MDLIAIRVPEEMKKKLEEIAKSQHRPLSNLIRLVLMQWLKQHEEGKENVSRLKP
jgi:predicted transcriptional regulator